LTAGFCEAIKHGAVGDRKLFERTRDFLARSRSSDDGERERDKGARRIDDKRPRFVDEGARRVDDEEFAELIARHCAFKAKVVAADERETVERAGALSRRVLNFGHTVGHALEALTKFRRFRHGEAVGYGMIVAAEISRGLGLLAASELESLRRTVALAGRLPRADDLDTDEILRAAVADKKSVGGELQWVLLERIGRAVTVGGREIPPHVLRESLRAGLQSLRGGGLRS
jgi:3-dehydroquinate synthase